MAECSESKAFKDLTNLDPNRAAAIRNIIIDKSSGVFLWVTLVTRRLLIEMQDGTGLIRAEKLLDKLPPGLDEYFKFMLDSIRPSDRAQAARIYQTMIWHELQHSRPTLMFLSFAGEDDHSFAYAWTLRCESLAALETRLSAMQRYFRSQSMDLLVHSGDQRDASKPWKDLQVDYLHRTVADFLRTPVPQDLLRSYAGDSFDVFWYCVNALRSQILLLEPFDTDPHKLSQGAIGKHSRAKPIDYLVDLSRIMRKVSSEHDGDVVAFFARVAPYMVQLLQMQGSHRSISRVLEGIGVQTQIDDLPLLLGMHLEIFPFVGSRLEQRAGLLAPQYCARYLSSDGDNPHMLALILRYTSVPMVAAPIAMFGAPRQIQQSSTTSADASHYGTVLADGLKDFNFVTQHERSRFSRFVDDILNYMGVGREDIINSMVAEARLTWTVRGVNTYQRPGCNGRYKEQHRGIIIEPPLRDPNRKRRRSDEDVQPPRQPGCRAQRPKRAQRFSQVSSATASSTALRGPAGKANPYVTTTNQQTCYPRRLQVEMVILLIDLNRSSG